MAWRGVTIVLPWERWLWQLTDIRYNGDESMLVLPDLVTSMPYLAAWWDAPYRIDFGEALDDTSAWSFPGTDHRWPWVAAVEPVATLQQHGIANRAMRVAPSDEEALHGVAVQVGTDRLELSPQGLSVFVSDTPEMRRAAGIGVAPAELVRVPADGEALFSASRNALLLVGGSELGPGERIRRYSIASAGLELVETDGDLLPSGLVLGAAFDHVENRLFVLDAEGDKSRLVVHDLDDGTARAVWSSSYAGAYASTFLGQLEDGQLVLLVADEDSWTAWSISITSENAVFSGRLDGEGRLVTRPAMGLHSLTLPVLGADGIHYVDLAAERFGEGAACSGL